ncbi:uncharacterized protein [Mytilus edulis]|uniref:uncharacterized protein n=1 Tax=Mytilus edulis TaxID=6550 RepID=UPI0039EF0D59
MCDDELGEDKVRDHERSTDTIAVIISINQNITGLAGKNDTYLTCSFTEYVNQNFVNIAIVSRNKQGIFPLDEPIVVFPPGKEAAVHPSAKYLLERVTLTNITHMSTHATIKFDNLKCEDEKDYICALTYINELSLSKTVSSDPTSISVKVSSSKPDNISSVIVWSAQSKKQEITSSTFLREGDTVTFTCTGNIGNPPGKFMWQMYSPQHEQLIVYSNATTEKEEMPENCTFRGTSNLTVHLTPDHFHAKYCCFEKSQKDVAGMYVETEPLNIHFQVNQVDITKHPNKKQYDQKTNNITLNCRGTGNPQPTYTWFKKGQNDSLLSNKSVYVITNVIRNRSGVYICEVYNSIDNINFRKAKSVEIHIVDDLQSSQESGWWKFVEEHTIPFICGVVGFIVFCAVIVFCICQKKKKNKSRCSQKTKSVGITMSTEYATVVRKNNTTSGETGDSMLVLNGMDRNKDTSRNKQEDPGKTWNATTSYQINEYAVPSDALQAGTITGKTGPGFTSFKDVKEI